MNESETLPDAQAEQTAWEWFAGAHPHEAHAKDPDRFWVYFQARRPGVTREEMARMLEETSEPQKNPPTEHCPEDECEVCGLAACPHGDPMHYHHDGCPSCNEASPTGVEREVCADIAARQRAGIRKYGRTVADNPLRLEEWLQHAYEECLDQAVYLKRAIQECRTNPPTEDRP